MSTRRALVFGVIAVALIGLGVLGSIFGRAYKDNRAFVPGRPRLTEITLERGGCYGTCARDMFTLRADGRASYVGKDYVTRLGYFSGKTYYFDHAAAWLEAQHYEALDSYYREGLVDADTATLTFDTRRDRKVVKTGSLLESPPEVYGIALFLLGIENQIDWKPASRVNKYLGYFIDDSFADVRPTMFIKLGGDDTIYIVRDSEPTDPCKKLRHTHLPERTSGKLVFAGNQAKVISVPEIPEPKWYGDPRATLTVRGNYAAVVNSFGTHNYRRVSWTVSREFESGIGRGFATKKRPCPTQTGSTGHD